MKISIIIPAYNSEKTIARTLDSILKQTYKNFQAIIVDDGSTDNTYNIIKEYESKDSRFISFHKENGGIASAYELAFKHIAGEYVTFVDSDDSIRPQMFEKIAETVKISNADVVHFGINHYDVDGQFLRTFGYTKKMLYGNEILIDYFKGISNGSNSPSLGIRAFRAKLMNGFDFYKGSIGIDEILTPFALSRAQSACFIEDKFYECVVLPNSVSRSELSKEKIEKILYSLNILSKLFGTFESQVRFWISVKKLLWISSVYDKLKNIIGKKELKKIIQDEYKVFKTYSSNASLKFRIKMFILIKVPCVKKLFI